MNLTPQLERLRREGEHDHLVPDPLVGSELARGLGVSIRLEQIAGTDELGDRPL